MIFLSGTQISPSFCSFNAEKLMVKFFLFVQRRKPDGETSCHYMIIKRLWNTCGKLICQIAEVALMSLSSSSSSFRFIFLHASSVYKKQGDENDMDEFQSHILYIALQIPFKSKIFKVSILWCFLKCNLLCAIYLINTHIW